MIIMYPLRACLLLASLALKSAAATVDSCPGYVASNLVQSETAFTADLKLAGPPCNAYGQDLTDLRLQVEYQTGKLPVAGYHDSWLYPGFLGLSLF